MSGHYPASFSAILSWSNQNGATVEEGQVRFVQGAILRAVAASRPLNRALVFKGGNALDFVWYPNRSTQDLDFSADMAALDPAWDLARIGVYLRDSLERALAATAAQLGLMLRMQHFEQQPPGTPTKPFITYSGTVGYALPNHQAIAARMRLGRPSPLIVPFDISLNERICATAPIVLAGPQPLRVSTAEDIVAEKLRALLQQALRNRTRRQDLLDIAVLLRAGVPLDPARVASYLLRKAAARDVPVSRAALLAPDLFARAGVDYDQLASTTRRVFIPLPEARALVQAFIVALPLPE
jgi:hypothetical protein